LFVTATRILKNKVREPLQTIVPEFSEGRAVTMLRNLVMFCIAWNVFSINVVGEEDVAPARDLVAKALKAELLGQTAERKKLLEQALSLDPDYAPARWHSGFVNRDGKWLTIRQAQEQAAQDDRMEQYWQHANAATFNVKDQLRLARWCDEQGLQDVARMHWCRVHIEQPRNREAAKRLGMQEYQNQFLAPEQVTAAKAYAEASERWSPLLKSWKQMIREGTEQERQEALTKLRQVKSIDAAPFLVEHCTDAGRFALEAVAVLGGMSPFETYGWLCLLAVDHDDPQVREVAASQLVSQLGRYPQLRYGVIPLLLSQLQVPSELNYYVFTAQTASLTLDSYGPSAILRTTLPKPNCQLLTPRFLAQLNYLDQAVATQKAFAKEHNPRVFRVLKLVADKQLPDDPQPWWDWWLDETERENEEYKPVFHRGVRIILNSCFVAGTPVWTETGPRPIERVKVGHRVLTQDSESGELAYRFVLKTTVRPPSKTLRIKIGNDEIWTTLGHLFWVSGQGWKMAKHLEAGDLVHSVDGAYPVTAMNKGPTVEAHNLVVDQFNTYFVGERPLLVHDNLPHRVTPTLVPGFVESGLKELAEIERE
jgi:hypothetical protein